MNLLEASQQALKDIIEYKEQFKGAGLYYPRYLEDAINEEVNSKNVRLTEEILLKSEFEKTDYNNEFVRQSPQGLNFRLVKYGKVFDWAQGNFTYVHIEYTYQLEALWELLTNKNLNLWIKPK